MSAPTDEQRRTVVIRFSTGGVSHVTLPQDMALRLVAQVAEAIDGGHRSIRIESVEGVTAINTRYVVLAELQ